MAKTRKPIPGPDAQFSESRNNVRLSIVVTQAQLDAVKEVVAAQNKKHAGHLTASSWGLKLIREALQKEGYKDEW